MVIFDIRSDNSHKEFLTVVNQGLKDTPDNSYLEQYGYVGSTHWWTCFDRGELPHIVRSGIISFVGLRQEEATGEEEDVVEFICDGQLITYDRLVYWESIPLKVGDCLSITYTIAEWHTRYGLMQCHIDVSGEWLPSHS